MDTSVERRVEVGGSIRREAGKELRAWGNIFKNFGHLLWLSIKDLWHALMDFLDIADFVLAAIVEAFATIFKFVYKIIKELVLAVSVLFTWLFFGLSKIGEWIDLALDKVFDFIHSLLPERLWPYLSATALFPVLSKATATTYEDKSDLDAILEKEVISQRKLAPDFTKEGSKLGKVLRESVWIPFAATMSSWWIWIKDRLGIKTKEPKPVTTENVVVEQETEAYKPGWFTSLVGILGLTLIVLIPTLVMEWGTGDAGTLRPLRHLLAFLMLFLGFVKVADWSVFSSDHVGVSYLARFAPYRVLHVAMEILLGFLLLTSIALMPVAALSILFAFVSLVSLLVNNFSTSAGPTSRGLLGLFPYLGVLYVEGLIIIFFAILLLSSIL